LNHSISSSKCTAKPDQPIAPKLKSLLIRNVDIHYEPYIKLLDVMKGRRTHNVGLKSLSIQSGHVSTLECKKEFEGLVEYVT